MRTDSESQIPGTRSNPHRTVAALRRRTPHSRKPKVPQASKASKATALPSGLRLRDEHGFVRLFCARVSGQALRALEQIRRHPAGAPPRGISRAELLILLVFHFTTHMAGGLAEHLVLFGMKMSASSLSQRRQATPWEVFVALMKLMLKPLAREEQQAEAFYQGLLLVALDATEFSLVNTEDILAKVKKTRSRSGKAAFAKLRCSVLLELINRNPLAVRIAREQESEWDLSTSLLEDLPERALVLGDRLYGCGKFVLKMQEVLKARGGHFLVRVRQEIKSRKVLERLKDGSCIVEITVRSKNSQVIGQVTVREIVVRAKRAGSPGVRVRLWTSLMNAQKAPAGEVAQTYMKRWEHELYYRELKHQMMTGDLLKSQTLDTACQEVAAMIMGTALLAEERMKIEAGAEPGKRVSLLKTWQYMEPLWLMLMVGDDLLSAQQKQAMAEKIRWIISQMLTPKRRSRSCPRVVRQPVRGWPRKRRQRSHEGPIHISVLKNATG